MPEFLKYALWVWSVFVLINNNNNNKNLYILNIYCLNLLKLKEILDFFQGPDQMSLLQSFPVPPGTVLLWHFVQLSINNEHIDITGDYSCASSSFVKFFRAQTMS